MRQVENDPWIAEWVTLATAETDVPEHEEKGT